MEFIPALEGESGHDGDLAIRRPWLHDVLEDTPGVYGALRDRFGRAVADGVQPLAKRKTLDRDTRPIASRDEILRQPPELAMVKRSDRITSLHPPPRIWDRGKIDRDREEALLILDRLGHCSPALAARLQAKINTSPTE